MNVLVLSAGSSKAFADVGYVFPKPLVEIAGRPLIEHVLTNLSPLVRDGGRMIVVIRHEDDLRYHVGSVIRLLEPNAAVVEVRSETGGAGCTALLAIDSIPPDEPLVIVNGDQLLTAPIADILGDFAHLGVDGGIIVFRDVHPRWSYVKCDDEGRVIEAAEKRPISNLATAGTYYFARGRDFIAAAKSMILKDAAVNGLFYICPVFNEMILRNAEIRVHEIPKSHYVSLALPQGVEAYARQIESKVKGIAS
jgi:NDP-sugar pyrophosphorylase family protein